ncbi:hypothetical protein FRAHR75_120121 [Frankia sp. Hr75.2]|nr:hypothetical protein FRAHR75_120121 [Frankia sp. Hr75.2]
MKGGRPGVSAAHADGPVSNMAERVPGRVPVRSNGRADAAIKVLACVNGLTRRLCVRPAGLRSADDRSPSDRFRVSSGCGGSGG